MPIFLKQGGVVPQARKLFLQNERVGGGGLATSFITWKLGVLCKLARRAPLAILPFGL